MEKEKKNLLSNLPLFEKTDKTQNGKTITIYVVTYYVSDTVLYTGWWTHYTWPLLGSL